jgi:hypothetical protein
VLVQAAKAAPSRAHWKLEPPSLEVKPKLALELVLKAGGPAVMVVFGGAVSAGDWIVQVWLAGVGSVLPAGSVARTWKVWEPSARAVYSCGLAQGAKAASSRAHWKLEPASLEVKPKLALVLVVDVGGAAVMVVFGGVVSTVHVWLAAVASVLPAGSVARTEKECDPSPRTAYSAGGVQGAKARPSRAHSKLEPSSLELKSKLALALLLRAGGPVSMLVAGATVSIAQV